ncbi:VOC family protein [Allorhizocola rhizosphaerae]|uniref:VOC family protein n=1 Tax=Allorhizocola rhizosphaerae TaxID=1872709 RepID=UPI0013C32654|nr:VOC family protein [Allorhizocola rhizosphaerae]
MVNFQITFDCADPGRLARFWAEALDHRVPDHGRAACHRWPAPAPARPPVCGPARAACGRRTGGRGCRNQVSGCKRVTADSIRVSLDGIATGHRRADVTSNSGTAGKQRARLTAAGGQAWRVRPGGFHTWLKISGAGR